MASDLNFKASDLNFKATELRLGLPGTDHEFVTFTRNNNNKRAMPESVDDNGSKPISSSTKSREPDEATSAPRKAQLIGWPPVRSYRKNNSQGRHVECETGIYVKVSLDGAPFLRKIDLNVYNGYSQLLKALENMFNLSMGEYSEREGYKGSEYAPAYEDKDGDLMLVGDVPWDMFKSCCNRLRIMKGSEAKGLGGCGA